MIDPDFIQILKTHEDNLKEFIKVSDSVTHAKLINEIDRVDRKITNIDEKVDRIIEHNKWQNGKLSKHDTAVIDLEKKNMTFEQYQVNCPANKFVTKLTKTRTWILISLAFVFSYIVLATLYHEVGIGEIVRLLFNKL